MVISSNLGFPRMGENRELKKLVESHWSGETSLSALLEGAKALRATHWKLQHSQGIQLIPSNDFSFYDHVLDHILLFGAIPPRYQQVLELDGAPPASWVGLKTYFAMARGFQSSKAAFDASCSRAGTAFDPSAASPDKSIDVGSMEMKKWFDTNYHYMVPEFLPNQEFRLTSTSADGVPKPVAEYLEAKALGIETRPVILGPLSFLLLGKSADASRPYTAMTDALVHLEALLPVYLQLLSQLGQAGTRWVQLDEPILALDLDLDLVAPRFKQAYASLRSACPEGLSLLVASYFGELRENFTRIVVDLPIHALHVDATRSSPAEVASIIANLPAHLSLSLGVIDGRNIWKTDLKRALELVSTAVQALGSERVLVAPSCSLLHSPHSLAQEAKKMDAQILDWLAFAVEKLAEISFLAQAATAGGEAGLEAHPNLRAYYLSNQKSVEERRTSPRIHVAAVKAREQGITGEMFRRQSAYPLRREQQRKRLTTLPAYFPTTTIGSFPQTKEVRAARSAFKNGKLGSKEYDSFLREQISACVKMQEECGLDVLVHGEFERTDMVEYFGEHLEGYVFTSNGWVQSYGSRCVKPPIIFGDVSRPRPMTLQYTTYAQSLTKKPMKGMLTGPVTILQWSFVRDDQPRSVTCFQLALAIRDEVADLESNGIACIQIDEPAIREGLPLRHSDWNGYLKWAVDSFLLSSTGIKDNTQIHTHMCYSDFNDIFEAIKRMDADVITIENSKSDLKLLRAFEKYGYTNEIGPGLYDIHSPRIPTTKEMVERVQQMLKYLDKASLWVNPDCGLKTRGWPETRAALENMVEVAHQLRLQFSKD